MTLAHYLKLGFALVPVHFGQKKPVGTDWQHKPITSPEGLQRLSGKNVGLLHSHSGTIVLDIDDLKLAIKALRLIDIDLANLLKESIPKILSNYPKPVFLLPPGLEPITKQLKFINPKNRKESKTVFELRGSGQDLLPPSKHPEGHCYTWENEPKCREDIPFLPEPFIVLLKHWDELEPLMQEASPWFEPPKLKARKGTKQTEDVIGQFNQKVSIHDALLSNSYSQKGKRYLAPSSSTKIPGVSIFNDEICFSHHASDPLNDGYAHDAFDVMRILECGGDFKQALDNAREVLGLEPFKPEAKQKEEIVLPPVSFAELQPLPELAQDPPDMSEDLIPEPLKAWLVDASQRTSTHLAFVSVAAICALGAVIGRTLGIHPKRLDDWLQVPNLWGGICAPPSSMKTSAIAEGMTHIKRLAAVASENFKAEALHRESQIELLKAEISIGKKATSKRAALNASELTELKRQIQALETQTEKRYIINDATLEKTGELLADNPRGLLQLRDELMGLLLACDKPGFESLRPFLLEAWNGTGSYTFDRISRGTLHIKALTLSVFGGIQPGKLKSYILGAIANSDQADGLLQRFQLLVWFDKPKKWIRIDRQPNKEAKNKAFAIFEYLDQLDPPLMGVYGDEYDPDSIPALRFSSEAQALFNHWLDCSMDRLRGDDLANSPAFVSHLVKYNTLVPCLALIFHLIDSANNGEATLSPVSLEALELAIAWADYLELHARKLYSLELDTNIHKALTLAEKIQEGEVTDGQTTKDVLRRRFPGLNTIDELGQALEVLTKANWVQVQEMPTQGRPKKVLRIHPDIVID